MRRSATSQNTFLRVKNAPPLIFRRRRVCRNPELGGLRQQARSCFKWNRISSPSKTYLQERGRTVGFMAEAGDWPGGTVALARIAAKWKCGMVTWTLY